MRFEAGVLAGLLATLVAVNGLIAHKEQIVRHGELVLLPLAPVDPRSLIQGDYMDLRYDLGEAERGLTEGGARDGFVVVRLDAGRVGQVLRVDGGEALGPGELRVRFRRRGYRLKIGAEAYHFQEGEAPRYEGAKFGELRVSKGGEVVLVGLRDKDKQPLGPPR